MKHQANQKLLQRLDAERYSENDLVVLTIPMTLPYPIHNGGYQRVDGEFDHNGVDYKLVKQKLENDTLFIVCFKDKESSKIKSALSEFSKVANNVPAGSKQALNFLGKLYKDFRSTEFKLIMKSRSIYERTYYALNPSEVIAPSISIDSPPPKG
jgi:hypothetical protein